jgi:hypothetical protein
MTLSKPGDIPTRFRNLGKDRPGEGQQSLANGREAQRPHVFLDQRSTIVTFQRFELV